MEENIFCVLINKSSFTFFDRYLILHCIFYFIYLRFENMSNFSKLLLLILVIEV